MYHWDRKKKSNSKSNKRRRSMNGSLRNGMFALLIAAAPLATQAKQWSLKDCIDYALANNISLQKTQLTKASAQEDYLQSKAALLPSLNASTNQSVNYTPWVASGISSDGFSRASIDKVYYNGTYSVAGNYTIWNGNKNKNQVKLNKLVAEAAELDSATQAVELQEQIATLYVQILYSTEAIQVNKESYKSSLENEERGKDIVQAESNVKDYKRQLKELLQITSDEAFDINMPNTTDAMALDAIPALNGVYAAALENRPEFKTFQNQLAQNDLTIQIAKAGKLPTISANAGVSTSSTSMNNKAWGTQLKTNFNMGGGISISVPLFDNRSTKTQVNKALIQRESIQLDLKNQQTQLYSTIEKYWLQASTNQSQFKAAKVSTESAQTSYDLLSEQFKLGLKNIVELRTGKDNLLKAKQNELQAKYMTILNLNILKFYKDGHI